MTPEEQAAVDELLAAITPDDSAMTAAEQHASERIQRLSSANLAVGDTAFDFDLPIYDFSRGTRRATDERFHLQSMAANTPVALIFGSYT